MIGRMLIAATAALALTGAAPAQDADHPEDRPLVVGSDFGVAPWMVRGAAGPEGFGVDMINEVARRIGRPESRSSTSISPACSPRCSPSASNSPPTR